MDVASFSTKATEFIKKYRYVAIVLALGLVLMALPTGKKGVSASVTANTESQQDISVNEALAEILCKIEGAGNVRVLLTVASGKETVYQTNDSITDSESSNTTKIDTVTVTDANRNQTGLIKQINPPKYQGAIIVCQGAGSASIRLAIVDAVSKVTGLSSDRISVQKMK
jgi:stage III sporulation protein AG